MAKSPTKRKVVIKPPKSPAKRQSPRRNEPLSSSSSELEEVTVKLTARQRAKLLPAENTFEPVLKQPTTVKDPEKSRRRANQREEKLEENKVACIQKLLQKQGTRSRKMQPPKQVETKVADVQEEMFASRYLDNQTTTLLIVPEIDVIPRAGEAKPPCAVCGEVRSGLHPQTGTSICHRLDCYRQACK